MQQNITGSRLSENQENRAETGAKLYANEQQHDIAIYGHEVGMMVIRHEQESWQ